MLNNIHKYVKTSTLPHSQALHYTIFSIKLFKAGIYSLILISVPKTTLSVEVLVIAKLILKKKYINHEKNN